MTPNAFIRAFRWEKDGRLDTWRILSPDATGKYRGDCDDFAATMSRIISGSASRMAWNVITHQHTFWYCKTAKGASHMALWVRGRGWIDNIRPEWSDECAHRLVAPVPFPMVGLKLALGVLK